MPLFVIEPSGISRIPRSNPESFILIKIDQRIESLKQYCERLGIQVNSYRSDSIQHNESLDIMMTVVQQHTDVLRTMRCQQPPPAHLHESPIKLRETNSDMTSPMRQQQIPARRSTPPQSSPQPRSSLQPINATSPMIEQHTSHNSTSPHISPIELCQTNNGMTSSSPKINKASIQSLTIDNTADPGMS